MEISHDFEGRCLVVIENSDNLSENINIIDR